jgi:hypothetical protein
VRLRLRDTPYSRAMWDHAFELDYEVVLGARDLALTLTARNSGAASFDFTAALHSYFGVQDVREASVMLLVRAHAARVAEARIRAAHCGQAPEARLACASPLLQGLQGTTFIDKFEDSAQPVMRVETPPAHYIRRVLCSFPGRRLRPRAQHLSVFPCVRRGPTDKIFVNSQARLALEVGTGCTVFVENTAGFTDHVVRPTLRELMWRHAPVYLSCVVCPGAGVEPLAQQRVLPQLRVRRERRRGRARAACKRASPLLTIPCARTYEAAGADPCLLTFCVWVCAQAAEWVGKSTLFVRDVVLSESMVPADDEDAPRS